MRRFVFALLMLAVSAACFAQSDSEKAKIAGINVPISAGIMPVTSKSQIERMVTMCGASLPQKFNFAHENIFIRKLSLTR